ncbi:uncharacterized protein BO87DRAFT_197139 [Aspergillus neoniger CBS 115656]|uniref:Uncharacterized protein n=1 Tax=Aspergillus neoniger (strain CBS 115656) TaxID=1448310 RepID=A0A318Y929_ASPNB|nr:hypothetical protein BO87DRAFT_197139 [Aspergillus neoniger CBS 115656]PYH29180.1 hypothetical protein BO87DRAFT_197139 [Aspergillus neoniger CBS 115656]
MLTRLLLSPKALKIGTTYTQGFFLCPRKSKFNDCAFLGVDELKMGNHFLDRRAISRICPFMLSYATVYLFLSTPTALGHFSVLLVLA